MNILIIDNVCYKPYDFNTLLNEPLGGSEASVLRAAKALAGKHNIYLLTGAEEQHINGITFIKPETLIPKPAHIIHVRSARGVHLMNKAYPNAKQIVWWHDLGDKWIGDEVIACEDIPVDFVYVSEYHKHQFIDRGINPYAPDYKHKGQHHVVYNIVEAAPRGLPVNINKLVFPSSPHKGLERTLTVFKEARRRNPALELHVFNPGYYKDYEGLPEGVTNHGPKPHCEVMKHVEEALCVFTMNAQFPETMGLVHAEANAVGTPVLAHKLGATPEILTHPRQLVDIRKTQEVLNRLESFTNDRPIVSADQRFNGKEVLKQWEKVL